MKIAVVGCGAVGSYYGAKLARAGNDVHFLLRSDYETVRRNGVSIRSPQGDFQVRPRCARTSEEIGPSELVLIQYHMHIPGPDPLTNTDTEARWKYYQNAFSAKKFGGVPAGALVLAGPDEVPRG